MFRCDDKIKDPHYTEPYDDDDMAEYVEPIEIDDDS